jgi:hypothetical protein
MQAEQDQRTAAQRQAHQQDFAGADMIGQIADRRLGQAGGDRKDGQREAKIDIADAELRLEERKQHRQHENMEVADPMRGRDRGQCPQRTIDFGLLRCGENIGHLEFNIPFAMRPGKARKTIG